MDKLEKIDRLRERASVTYEEARDALAQSGDDLLDAIVLLEKQGKVRQPEHSSYSTQYEEQKEYIRVQDKVEEQRQSAPSFTRSLYRIFHFFFRFTLHTSFHVRRRERDLFLVPTWVLALALIFFWRAVLPLGVIAMLFGIRYSFEGNEDTDTANEILHKAGRFADGFEHEMRKDKDNSDEHKNTGRGR